MTDEQMPARVLRWATAIELIAVIALLARGESRLALGVSVGAVLGLGSLWTITWAVPRCLSPEKRRGGCLLGVILFLKLPLYALLLNYALVRGRLNGLAIFLGVAAVPLAILLVTLSQELSGRNTDHGRVS